MECWGKGGVREQAAIFEIPSFCFISCFFNVLFTYANRISVQFNCAARLGMHRLFGSLLFFPPLLQQSGRPPFHMEQPTYTSTSTHTHTRPTQSHTHTQTFIAAFLFDQLLICTKPQTSRATAELPRFLFVMCVSVAMRIGYVVCSCVCVCVCRCEHVSVLVLLLFVFFVERL